MNLAAAPLFFMKIYTESTRQCFTEKRFKKTITILEMC